MLIRNSAPLGPGLTHILPRSNFPVSASLPCAHDIDVYIEQACATHEVCLAIRQRCSHPSIMDENIDGLGSLVRGAADRGLDVVHIEVSKVGGEARAAQARDLGTSLEVAMMIDDTWRADVVTAAISHLAHSTASEWLFTATDFNSHVTINTTEGATQRKLGPLSASMEPGLGILARPETLGEQVLVIEGQVDARMSTSRICAPRRSRRAALKSEWTRA